MPLNVEEVQAPPANPFIVLNIFALVALGVKFPVAIQNFPVSIQSHAFNKPNSLEGAIGAFGESIQSVPPLFVYRH